jgi:hypothetical protein
MMGYGIT